MNSFYSAAELAQLGLKKYGKNLKISRHVCFYLPEKISIGDDVRIDDFCILSGSITIGSNVHISAYCGLYGAAGITIKDYAGISPKSLLFSATDDFSGEYMVGPQVTEELRNVIKGPIVLQKYVQVGASNVILPNTILHTGAATGAITLVKSDLPEWTISVGIPATVLKKRSRNIEKLVQQLEKP